MSRIFIIEDEAIIAADIAMSLEYEGYTIHGIAASAEDAVERISHDGSPPDLVIVDIMLAGKMDGVEACRLLGEKFGVPALFLTSHTDASTIDRASRAGAYGYVVKPFTEAELKASVEVALEKAASHREERAKMAREAYVEKLESLALASAGTAHLFNNLLQVITGYSELLAAETPLGSRFRNIADQIVEAADRACEISGKMRDFTGSIRVFPLLTDLRDLAVSVGAETAATPSEPCLAVIDPRQVETALRCLVENALESLEDMGDGKPGEKKKMVVSAGRIGMGAEELQNCDLYQGQCEGEYCFVEVRDSGTGMDAETRKRMFDPFFTTRFIGRGLGLAVVMGIVRSLHGLIRVETAHGKGTAVRLLFQAAVHAERPQETA